MINTNRIEKSKIRFFKPNEENQKEFPKLNDMNNSIDNNMNNNAKLFRIRNNNSSGKINVTLKDKDFRGRKNMDIIRLNLNREYNNLLRNNNKFQNNNYILSSNNNNNMNFRRPFLCVNKIKIEREEIKKDRIQFFLKNKSELSQKQDLLQKENMELNKALNDVCDNNEMLKEDLNSLKNKIREIEKENLEKEKLAQKKEKENQTLFKKMSSDIDELKNQ